MARYRQGRLNEEIRKSISNLLLNGIKDPALTSRIISVSGVEVTSDGSYATCYVTPLALDGEDKEEVYQEVLAAFNRAKGTFRRQVGRDVKMRQVPELIFKLDTSMDYGRHIDAIIEEINQEERSADPEGSAE